MPEVKFGRRQFGKPTPAKIGFAILIINVVASALQVWMGTASYIPSKTSEVLMSILGLIILLSNALKPFFGTSIPEEYVPTEKVTEVETEKKD